ncbi:acyl-CoA thioesterase [bacterium J10(2018)]|jgi:acyl-CoA thioester hydrolase|nr:acyl-CoA thioesterase [bacterium J10(2018)]
MPEEIKLPHPANPRVPAPQFPFRHMLPLQMRFNDFDMLGHLNNAVYIQFFDLGKSSYFQDVLPQAVDWKHINIVVVNINCDYYAPTYIHESVAVVTTVTRMGEKSFSLEQRIVNTATGEVKCVARTVMAGIDLTTGKSAPIAEEWIEALQRYERRAL